MAKRPILVDVVVWSKSTGAVQSFITTKRLPGQCEGHAMAGQFHTQPDLETQLVPSGLYRIGDVVAKEHLFED